MTLIAGQEDPTETDADAVPLPTLSVPQNGAATSPSRIRIGQVFRVSRPLDSSQEAGTLSSYVALTRGNHDSCADIQKGIWAYKSVNEPGQDFKRVPAILLHSNPYKEGSQVTPWVDIVRPELGYAIYNGDNRQSGQGPFDARGNSILLRCQSYYSEPGLRKFAPPILLFTQRETLGNRAGYREFSGFGVPTRFMLVSQREQSGEKYFTNLVVELTLFRLDIEDEQFDWRWIDARRNGSLDADAALRFAPAAWRLWIKEGEIALERCRRRVSRLHVVPPAEQMALPGADERILHEVSTYFADRRHMFEGLASLIAQRVIGLGCKRGWVTKRSGDGGVDFVCRLDLGSDFSRVPVVILGQAKCERLVSGKDLARLVARLQRGWIGVFVTTGAFSRASQEELVEDKYPVILINGQRIVREIRMILAMEGITLAQLLERESAWYHANLQPVEPSRILDDVMFGTALKAGQDE